MRSTSVTPRLAPAGPPGCSAISSIAFAARLRRESELRAALDGWLADVEDASWVEWEQRKHERLLTAA
jgi:hypothetical protein